jgi:hypothetical protein
MDRERTRQQARLRGLSPKGKEIRRRGLLKKYGLTLEDYDRMVFMQGGGCAICGSPEGGGIIKLLYVDHDHKTGNVRGLLCQPCNAGIGNFLDNPDLMKEAIAYLKWYQPNVA